MSIATESPHREIHALRGQSLAAIWHKSAPCAVQEAFSAGRRSAGWKAWQRWLGDRRRPAALVPSLVAADCELTWTLTPDEIAGLCLPQYAETDSDSTVKALHKWFRDVADGERSPCYALSALGWCRRLPELAASLPAGAWWRLLDHLLQSANAADAGGAPGSEDSPLIRQLLAGELALTLAYLFPEIVPCRQLMPQARRVLSAGLSDLLDGQGLPHARHFDLLRPLLACWTRSGMLASRLKQGCWDRNARRQYRRLVRIVLQLARPDGSHVYCNSTSDRSVVELFTAATALGGNRKDRKLAATWLSGGRKRKKRLAAFGKALPKASLHSEWAAAAVLRPDWSRSAPRLTVLYPGAACRVELGCGKDVLCSGQWALEVRIDGRTASPCSDWTEVCWVSSDKVDYLELEIDLDDGHRVQRQLLLARNDRVLLLADAVLASRPAVMEYRGTLPLCRRASWHGACETREGALVGRKPRGKALPLALPEWLVDRRGGELVSTAAGLELRQAATARALWTPLFFDLDQRRMAEPLTWRQLTVTESLAVQPADVAVGYRVAIGRKQWLIYRSLARSANRSLLGHNLQSETLLARFSRKGKVDPIVEIE